MAEKKPSPYDLALTDGNNCRKRLAVALLLKIGKNVESEKEKQQPLTVDQGLEERDGLGGYLCPTKT